MANTPFVIFGVMYNSYEINAAFSSMRVNLAFVLEPHMPNNTRLSEHIDAENGDSKTGTVKHEDHGPINIQGISSKIASVLVEALRDLCTVLHAEAKNRRQDTAASAIARLLMAFVANTGFSLVHSSSHTLQ